ncbi:MAG: HEAT repeat domain-containing protein [bacterium]
MAVKITDLTNDLIKSIKAAQIYQTTHPSFKNFFNKLYNDLGEFLKTTYQVTFQIERFSIRYENYVVYEETEKDLSIAFRLFRDGIREIRFNEGITADELLIFLEVISRTDRDQDIALNLWECDFSHITFYVVEEEEEKIAYSIPELPKMEINYDEAVKGTLSKEKIEFADKISADITPEELRQLKSAVIEAEKQLPVRLIISTLIEVLKVNQSQEVIDALVEILELSISTNDFNNACYIVNQLWNYNDINLIAQIETEALVMGFAGLPEILDEQSFNDFTALIGFFTKKSVPHFVRILKNIKNQQRLVALQGRIAYICQGDPSPLIDFLKSSDLQILTNAIIILGLIKNRTIIPLLKNMMVHPSSQVRMAIIEAFTELGEAKMTADFLDDLHPEVRIKALKALERMNYPPIYQRLLKTIKNRNFLKLNYDEQKAYFNCLVANRDSKITRHLEQILFKWTLFSRKKYLIKRQLAAQALVKLNSPKAVEILQKGRRRRSEDIRAICENALKFVDKKTCGGKNATI